MKLQSNRPDISEMPPYRLGRHWNTIQAYLIPGLEDDIGELSEELKKFMGICELLDVRQVPMVRERASAEQPHQPVQGVHPQGDAQLSLHQDPDRRREGIADHPAPLRLGVRRRHPGQVPVLADVQGVRQGRHGVEGACRVPGGEPRAQRRHARKPRLLGDRGEGERRDAQERRKGCRTSGRDAHRTPAEAGRGDELRGAAHGLRLGLQAQQQGQDREVERLQASSRRRACTTRRP